MKRIVFILAAALLLATFAGCEFFNIGTLEWTVAGNVTLEEGAASLNLSAFYRKKDGSSFDFPNIDSDNYLQVSNTATGVESTYSLDISAPDAEVTASENHSYIDLVFWEDVNGNGEFDSGDKYDFAIAADDQSVFPLWISFHKTGEDIAGVPYRWEVYGFRKVAVSYQNLSAVNIKPFGNPQTLQQNH